jgi:hypothetical protein
MIRLRETRGDQLVPNTLRKRYIYKIVTVNVTNLSSPEAILCAAEAVRVSLNSEFESRPRARRRPRPRESRSFRNQTNRTN